MLLQTLRDILFLITQSEGNLNDDAIAEPKQAKKERHGTAPPLRSKSSCLGLLRYSDLAALNQLLVKLAVTNSGGQRVDYRWQLLFIFNHLGRVLVKLMSVSGDKQTCTASDLLGAKLHF
jgi:hypothetical protein